MSGLIKVLIVDDHESMRDSLKQEFCPENGFEVIGSIAGAADAEMFCGKYKPALVITDVCTDNDASGLEAAAAIRAKHPEIKIIVTSGFDEVTYAPRAKELGAHAFVYKSKSLAHYREVARRVLGGETVFPEPRTIPLPQGETPFTDREMEVLRLMCKHMTSENIAKELFISLGTVKYHKANMLAKTGFPTSVELAFYVLTNGWINPKY
ncbi:MAG: response regulator transcription factor [Oscillospiraceae bacterium]|nr:response regulator transcription factor [Oscillospiraceae bacterium]